VQLSEGATRARQARRLLQRVLEFVPAGVELRTGVRIGRRADEGIVELAAEEEADLILFGWGGPDRGRRSVAERDDFQPVFSPTIDEVIRERPCDIAVVKQRGIGDVSRIVAPVRGGPHAEMALRYASSLRDAFEAELNVLHVVPPGTDADNRAKRERNLGLFVERHTGDAAAARIIEGEDVTEAIRSETCGEAASRVAALPAVRLALMQRQRAFQAPPGLVADGRDMGSVVFPAAVLKIFLTASHEERAKRRYKQLKGKGKDVNLRLLQEDIATRDSRDAARAASPLKPADDAVQLDTTDMDIETVVERVMALYERG